LASAAAAAANNVDLTRHVIDLATRAGAGECDAVLVAYDESEVTVRLGETERLMESGSRSLGLRVIQGGRTAICSTSDLSEASLERLARETVELASISAPDEHAGLPDQALFATRTADGMGLFDEQVESLGTEEKIRMAHACEAAAFAFDPRINNSDGASVGTRSREVVLANSLGFSGSYRGTNISVTVEVMADDADGKKRNAYWFSQARALHRLDDVAEVGRIAARRAVDQIGARKMATTEVPVVFEPIMAARLMGIAASSAMGTALYRGSTFLARRLGEVIGSPLVTITDDPLVSGAAGTRPFDGEGVTTRVTPIFEAGRFNAFLFDCYTGRRTGNTTTGSASRGIESGPAPSSSNLIWSRGETPAAEIVAGVKDGFYLTALMGFGFNQTTGDFSNGAAGFWIENGKLAYPVTEVNVSGRLDQMLADIDAVGDDLTWFGGAAAPTVRVAKMTVSGT
jgi:PmbA protein